MRLVLKVPRDLLVQPERLVLKAHKVRRVIQVQPERLVHKVLRDLLERLVHKALKDLLVLRARLVLLEQLVGI